VKKLNRKVVIHSSGHRAVLPLVSIAKDRSFFIVEEGPGAFCYVRWDAGRNAWTIGKRTVEVKGV